MALLRLWLELRPIAIARLRAFFLLLRLALHFGRLHTPFPVRLPLLDPLAPQLLGSERPVGIASLRRRRGFLRSRRAENGG